MADPPVGNTGQGGSQDDAAAHGSDMVDCSSGSSHNHKVEVGTSSFDHNPNASRDDMPTEAAAEHDDIDDGDDDNLPHIVDADSHVESESSSDDDDNELTEPYAYPPHSWASVASMSKREMGGHGRCRSDVSFRRNVSGSLHMVQRLELMYKLEGHDGCVNCIHFNSDGSRLLSGSDDMNVVMWNWATNKALLTIQSGHRANIFQAKFLPMSNDLHVVTCGRDGQIRLAQLHVDGTCAGTRKLGQHRSSAHKLALESDSMHCFLTCGEDGMVYTVDVRKPKPVKLLACESSNLTNNPGSRLPLYSISSNPCNPFYFAVSGRDPYVRLYDKRMVESSGWSPADPGVGLPTPFASPVTSFCPEHISTEPLSKHTTVTCVVYNHDGSELLATYNDEHIYTFDSRETDGKSYSHVYKGHRNNATVKGVNYYGPNSEFIVSGSDCGYVYLWERKSEKIVQFFPADEGGVVNCLEPHPTCPVLATSGLDDDIKIWVPSCEDPKFSQKRLRHLTAQNDKSRRRDQELLAHSRGDDDGDSIDPNMLFYVWARMRRATRRNARRRRRMREGNGVESSDALSSDSDSDADSMDVSSSDSGSGEEEGNNPSRSIQCQQS